MKKIKTNKLLLGMTLLALVAMPVVGSDNFGATDSGFYRASETSLDIFGSGSVGQRYLNNTSGFKANRDVQLGVGVGLNHFFTRHFGLGIEAYSEDTQHRFVDNASISFIGRLPINDSGFAPYVFGGGGQQYDPARLWFVHLGGGVEYRFTDKIGLFTDVRYVFTDGAKDQGLGRLGVRFIF